MGLLIKSGTPTEMAGVIEHAMSLRQAANPEGEIAAADHPRLRFFSVKRMPADTPQTDCEGSWAISSPVTAGDFSAVGYFFARHLLQQLDVPIGILGRVRLRPGTCR